MYLSSLVAKMQAALYLQLICESLAKKLSSNFTCVVEESFRVRT